MKKEIEFRIDYADNGIIASELIEGTENPDIFGKREVYEYGKCDTLISAIVSFATKIIPHEEKLPYTTSERLVRKIKIVLTEEKHN